MEIVAIALEVGTGTEPLEDALRGRPAGGLVLFPEATLGPFPDGRDAARDRRAAEPIPGSATEELGRLAARHRVWLATGLVERDGDALYDSAVLIDPSGAIVLHYRRIHPGWFFPDADRDVYRCGDTIPVAETPFGRTAFAICGDLFDDAICDRIRDLALDLLLVPLARSLEEGPSAWPAEVPYYAERVARIGVPALIANRCDGEFVGGALAIERDGRVRSGGSGRGMSTLESP